MGLSAGDLARSIRRAAAVALAMLSLTGAAEAAGREPYPFDRSAFPAYRMTVEVDRTAKTLDASGEVEVPRALVRDGGLVLALAEAASNVHMDAMTPRGSTALSLTRVDNASVPAELRRWRVALPADAGRGPIRLRFRHRMANVTSLLFAIGPAGAFASASGTAWYPQVERADGVRMAGLGRLQIASRGDTVISGGTASRSGVFEIASPRYFDFAAGAYREVASHNGRSRLYLLSDHPGSGLFAERLEATVTALEALFGPLPQARFDLVEAPSELARAAGFDGASLDGFMMATGFYFDQPYNTAFFGHEVSHQWWGALIRRKGPSGAYLLDESLAQFGSLLAVEAVEGEGAAELYRRRGFPGYYAEYSGFGYLARSLAGIDAPLIALPADDGFTARRVANSKAMLAWSMLADLMGRRQFTDFLRRFAGRHAYERVTLDEFMAGLRAAMGDKAWFLDAWFAGKGAPTIRLTWSQTKSAVTITLQRDGPRSFVPVTIVMRSSERIERWLDTPQAQTAIVGPVRGAVQEVLLDPHHRVLRWTDEDRAEAQAVLPYTRPDIALNRGQVGEAKAGFTAALAGIGPDDLYALRARIERGLGDVAMGDFAQGPKDPKGAVEHYRRALAARPQFEDQLPELWRSLAVACDRAALGCGAGARAAGSAAIQRELSQAKGLDDAH